MLLDSSKIKVLVIEDEESVRANILEILESEGFDVIGANNGSIGIEEAKNHIPDLILCDIMMPDIDGYSVLSELQEEPLTAIIPFIFLTAKTERDDLRLAMELGADDYITKPCTVTELLSAITSRLKKQAVYNQQYETERSKAKGLQARVQELQRLSVNRGDLLQKLTQELRDPLSVITMAIQMLKLAPTEQARANYLRILQQECAREIAIINQLSDIQDILVTENVQLLQRFKYSKDQTSNQNFSD
ncbi:response regulator [Phormidium sp. LEGE 05292]|uniref:ATP-binding response regulator n=1 Tax=[Phormidium] sp. LEGE 05292 TaxID=767427 RepID=UPI001882E5B5|nr:response regulator [Phormidium sp. LEGE 05292]MBE9228807.1 response regulator [Phormidium sp. LEGE 05292]